MQQKNGQQGGAFAGRLRAAIGERTIREFATAAGLSPSGLQQYLSGRSEPGLRALNAIADTGGVRIEWLLTGNGPMTGSASHGKDQEAITIEMLDVRVSAGDGEWVLEEVSLGQFVLDQPYFQREIGLDPALCRIVKVSGDSMEPTFRSGDPVLVNLAENQQPADGIWVIRIGLGTFVKRLQFMLGGTVRVVSDNPAYQDQVLDLTEEQPDFQMIGRVVWSPRLH